MKFLPCALLPLFLASSLALTAEEQKPEDIVKTHFSSVALIEGDVSTGTGFIIREGETLRLYTAAHVLCGNKRLKVKNADGREFKKFGTFEVASASDLARIEMKEDFATELAIAGAGSVAVDDPLLAIGDGGGVGVLKVIDGKAVSVGPDTIEVTNGVIQGNSGGPVFSESGHVVAVVTHALAAREDLWAKDTDFAEVRRFATRVDRDITWQKMPIVRFLGEADRIETFDRHTRLLFAIAALEPTTAGLRLDTRVGDGPTILSILEENEDLPLVAQLIEMNRELGGSGLGVSESDLVRKFSGFYRDAVRTLDRNVDEFDEKAFSGYNRESAKQSREWRDEALKAIDKAAERLR